MQRQGEEGREYLVKWEGNETNRPLIHRVAYAPVPEPQMTIAYTR